MHKTPTIKSIFVFLSYGLMTQSLTTITSERTVVPQKNNTYEFHNDAEELLPKPLRSLIGEYALDLSQWDPSLYKVRAIYKHPSRKFAEHVKEFDALPEPTYPHKAVTSYGESCYNTVRVTNLYIQGLDCQVIVHDPIAHDGPLKDYSRTAIAKTCPNPHNTHRIRLLFKYVLELNGKDYIRTPGVLIVAEQEPSAESILQRAGLHPVQSKYCSVLQCWQLANCAKHR
ncbi:MAG: hypothetical protein IT346_05290 [Epsilonproteobacteria bacterium]|nr:hypothetical protein [Campylobacterota bacterium]